MPLLCRSGLKSRGILYFVGGVVAQMSQEDRQVFDTFTEARVAAMEKGGQRKQYSKSSCRRLYNLRTVL